MPSHRIPLLITLIFWILTIPAYADFLDGWEAYNQGDYHTAINEWVPLAHQGDVAAQYALGTFYNQGKGGLKDHSQAAYWYKKAAEQGMKEAQFALGAMYYYGQGIPQSYKEAEKEFRLAAEQGLAEAQFYLGHSYFLGYGVIQDYTEAAKWYRLAVEQGEPHAQARLGYLYLEGKGVIKDYSKANHLLLNAANKQVAFAQYFLGIVYIGGLGVQQDNVKAHMWLNLAAAQEEDDGIATMGRKARDFIAKKMTSEQITKAQRMAREWDPTNANFAIDENSRIIEWDYPSIPSLNPATRSKFQTPNSVSHK